MLPTLLERIGDLRIIFVIAKLVDDGTPHARIVVSEGGQQSGAGRRCPCIAQDASDLGGDPPERFLPERIDQRGDTPPVTAFA